MAGASGKGHGSDRSPFAEVHKIDSTGSHTISDETFFAMVGKLRALRDFLSQAAIPLQPTSGSSFKIGNIYQLRFSSDGREATADEWDQVNAQIQEIYALLGPRLRRTFLATETPWLVPSLASLLLFASVLDILLLVVINERGWFNGLVFGGYLIFSTSLGALGALASIALNAILIQSDIKFDVSNPRLIAIRVVVGALFGCILDLPFGYNNFFVFITNSNFVGPDLQLSLSQAMLLLLPFIFGYSTSVVLVILNRLAESVENFFGKEPDRNNTYRTDATESDSRNKSSDSRALG